MVPILYRLNHELQAPSLETLETEVQLLYFPLCFSAFNIYEIGHRKSLPS
jgi:hypothetical protein